MTTAAVATYYYNTNTTVNTSMAATTYEPMYVWRLPPPRPRHRHQPAPSPPTLLQYFRLDIASPAPHRQHPITTNLATATTATADATTSDDRRNITNHHNHHHTAAATI